MSVYVIVGGGPGGGADMSNSMGENDRQQDKERRTMNNILSVQHISVCM